MKNPVKVSKIQAMQVEARYYIGGTVRKLNITDVFTLVDADHMYNAMLLVTPNWYGHRHSIFIEVSCASCYKLKRMDQAPWICGSCLSK